jgi:hypothetical protein
MKTYGGAFNYSFPKGIFVEPDAGQTLSYTASGLPPGLAFTGPTRTFNGTPATAGTNSVTVTATDDGTPPLSTTDMFDIIISKAPLIATADSTNRPYGQTNPAFTGSLTGVTNGDNITAMFNTTASPISPPGGYPITPAFVDPDSKLANYTVTTNLGTLTINGVTVQLGSSGGSASLCWSTNAAAFVLECATNLTPPVTWQAITSDITTNDTTICYTAPPDPAIPSRYYRLHRP